MIKINPVAKAPATVLIIVVIAVRLYEFKLSAGVR